MRAERFGSYSIEKTFAGTPGLLRLKSMIRYIRLWPPPRWRVVTRPWLLRPACFCNGSTRLFSGLLRVISSKVETDIPRRPGDVGLYFLTGTSVAPFGKRGGQAHRASSPVPGSRPLRSGPTILIADCGFGIAD